MKRAMIGLVAVIGGLMLGAACEERPGNAQRGGTTSSPASRGPGAPASPSGSSASERGTGGMASGSATSSSSSDCPGPAAPVMLAWAAATAACGK